ncbi:MAG: DAK2 domain-containing protein [Clostridia bacterium]|nr:DAK2 domain-containing protein [Clostridia bacterium]
MILYIDNEQLIEMFKGALANLSLNRAYVDSLNVFPVPDGDTGTNMGLTMTSTVRALEEKKPDNLSDTADAFSRGALNGARGNSGVILSQIFKGMSVVIKEAKVINTKVFAEALLSGAQKAYSTVEVPKEGTILTVVRVMCEYAVKISSRTKDFLDFMKKVIRKGEEALAETPKLLPILAKAGVVDSGGQGLIYILVGMYNVLAGIPMESSEPIVPPTQTTEKTVSFFNDVHDLENIRFAYCTEFFIINLKKQVTTADLDKLKDKLSDIGDCVLVVGDLDTVKVHVHTNAPDRALGYALQLGELNLPKIENMLEQNRKLIAERKQNPKKNGMLAICSGDGFFSAFKDLGADEVLEGGQTMNPSVNDIVAKINRINAENVFVLPNNKNVIMACEQAKDLVETNLIVIPTENTVQGISAAMMFAAEGDPEQMAEEMTAAFGAVSCIQVTHAVRDTEIDGFNLHNGDIIALEKGIVAQGSDVNSVVRSALERKDKDEICSISLYYGQDVTDEEAAELCGILSEEYPDSDVIITRGGQAHYYYLIGVE